MPAFFRQPRRRLLPLAVVTAAGVALLVVSLRLGLAAPLVPGAAMLVFGVCGFVDVLHGYTQLDRHGIVTVRWRRHRIGWAQVSRISAIHRGAGRYLRVVTTAGHVRALVAPRSAVFAVDTRFDQHAADVLAQWRAHRHDARLGRVHVPRAVVLGACSLLLVVVPVAGLLAIEHPWLRPWWPGVHAATALPDPCHAIPADTLRRVVGHAAGRSSPHDDEHNRFCQWGTARNVALSVEYRLRESGFARGADQIRKDLDSYASDPGWRPVPGVGDQCLAATERTWDLRWSTTVRARRVNVRAIVVLAARRPMADNRSTALRLTRQVLSRVELS